MERRMKNSRLLFPTAFLFLVFAVWVTTAQAVEAQITTGSDHTVVIKKDGTLWAWGLNAWYQLCDGGSTPYTNTPAQIGTDTNWKAVAAGDQHTVAVKTNGTLWQCGDMLRDVEQYEPVLVQIGTDTDWATVAAGHNFNFAIKTNGTLWAWGANWNGQLGLGDLGADTYATQNAPVQVGSDNTWTKVVAGLSHTVALKANGTLWAWGANGDGQLGNNSYGYEIEPVQIGSDNTWTDIAAGAFHTVAVKTNGTLWAWGKNDEGQLGDGTTVTKNEPVPIPGSAWLSVAAGDWHTLGRVKEWSGSGFWMYILYGTGLNGHGQLGIGDDTTLYQLDPVQVPTGNNWLTMKGGSLFSIGLMGDGSLWAWGDNTYGQLGIGTDGVNTNKISPVRIMNLFRNTLTVKKNRAELGTVTSTTPGIHCGADCTQDYDYGTDVILNAVPAPDSIFLGWSGGGCSGTGTCTVTVDSNKTVIALFQGPFYWPMYLPALTNTGQ